MNKENQRIVIAIEKKAINELDDFLKEKGINESKRTIFTLMIKEFIDKYREEEIEIKTTKVTTIKRKKKVKTTRSSYIEE